MKSRTVLKESVRESTSSKKERQTQWKDLVDAYIRDTNRNLKEIKRLQKNEAISDEEAHDYWIEAVGSIMKIDDKTKRNHLRYIPAIYKSQKHSESGQQGFSELRHVRNLERQNKELSQKMINITAQIEAETSGGERFEAAVNKKASELVKRKDTEIALLNIDIARLKKTTPANITIDFDLYELSELVRNFYKTGKDKGKMTIEEGKIAKLE